MAPGVTWDLEPGMPRSQNDVLGRLVPQAVQYHRQSFGDGAGAIPMRVARLKAQIGRLAITGRFHLDAAGHTLGRPVLHILWKRHRAGTKPGRREADDTARVALLVQDGGMRGVISAAMMCALDDLGFKDTFDDVYAHSAGAMNAAYFLAGSTWFPLSIYYDDLATKEFVDFTRPFFGEPIMSLDFAFDEVVKHRKPLDLQAITSGRTHLHIPLTILSPPSCEIVSAFNSPDDLQQTLRATCWLPIATNGAARWRGLQALDGGVLMPDLEVAARRGGATHVLSIQTRARARRPLFGRLADWYVRRRLDQLDLGLGQAYERALVEARQPPPSNRWGWVDKYLAVKPLPTGDVSRQEIRPHRLLSAARSAYGVMYALLSDRSAQEVSEDTIQVIPRLTIVHQSARAERPAADNESRP